MAKILKVDFRAKEFSEGRYSADVYALDMRKHQFQVIAPSADRALDTVWLKALEKGLQGIKCVALYRGHISERQNLQVPEKIWREPMVSQATS